MGGLDARLPNALRASVRVPVAGTWVPVHNLCAGTQRFSTTILCFSLCSTTPGRECAGSLPPYLESWDTAFFNRVVSHVQESGVVLVTGDARSRRWRQKLPYCTSVIQFSWVLCLLAGITAQSPPRHPTPPRPTRGLVIISYTLAMEVATMWTAWVVLWEHLNRYVNTSVGIGEESWVD